MYTVSVKNHIMIAHSLPDPFFGPAQNMHGATYHAEAIFSRQQLTDKNVVIDIGAAAEMLADVLKPLAYQNLDELSVFEGQLTTTEFLAKYIHDQINAQLPDDIGLKVILYESDQAFASYES